MGDIISILAYVFLFHKFPVLPPHLADMVIKIICLMSNKNLCEDERMSQKDSWDRKP